MTDNYQDPTPYDELIDKPSISAADKMLTTLDIPITDENRRAMMTGISYALRHVRDIEYPPKLIMHECPFCGHLPDPRNYVDSIHPVNKDHSLWVAGCPDTEGGCGVTMIGKSRADAVSKWNQRAYKKPAIKRMVIPTVPDEPMKPVAGGSDFLIKRFEGQEDGTGM
jgi:hypothetical protein